MKFALLFLFAIIVVSAKSQSGQQDTLYLCLPVTETVHITGENVQEYFTPEAELQKQALKHRKEHPRLMAAVLCLTLGPFGAHRLYLGTKPAVPVAYTLTLGGGLGVLPVIDLLVICFSRDITPYKNNPRVFMWVPEE